MIRAYHKKSVASCSPAVPAGQEAEAVDGRLISEVAGHLSIAQLLAANLPDLPSTQQGIDRLAKRQGWRFTARAGRGGGRLFAIADLPAETRAAILARRAAVVSEGSAIIGRPRGTDYFGRHPEVADAVRGWLAQRPLAARTVHKLILMDFPDHPVLPTLRTLQRFINRFNREERVILASLNNPDAYKSKFRLSLGRVDAGVSFAHELWELDTTPADVMTVGPDGKPERKAILGVIDRWSRRANFMLADSESGQSVRRLLIDTIRKWGVMPTTVMTDGGSGYINQSIQSALAALGIEHWQAPPGSGEKKPHIERLFGTFTRERAELLDGFIGHNVSDAQRLRARARKETGKPVVPVSMTADELQATLSNWLDAEYHVRRHGSLGMSPMARWQSSKVPATKAPGEDVLRLALSAYVGQRRVGKRGVRWKDGRYWSPALAAWMDRDVMIRRDEDDLGALFAFSPDGAFIDTIVDHTRSGLSQEAWAKASRQQVAAHDAARRAELKALARKHSIAAVREKLLRDEAEQAGKLVHLFPAAEPASTPLIHSLAGRTAAAPAKVAAAPRPDFASVTPLARTPAQKMREADAVVARAAAGIAVDPTALRKAQLYQTTSEYRVERMLHDDFAPSQAGEQAS